jgi:hypothetical protein
MPLYWYTSQRKFSHWHIAWRAQLVSPHACVLGLSEAERTPGARCTIYGCTCVTGREIGKLNQRYNTSGLIYGACPLLLQIRPEELQE